MKKINISSVFISIFLLSASYAQSQEKYYYGSEEERVFLNKVENKIVVSYDPNYLSEIRTNLQKNAKIRHNELQIGKTYSILTTTEYADAKAVMDSLKKHPGVKSVNPMYACAFSGLEMGFTDEILVKFKENVSQWEKDSIYRKYRLEFKRNGAFSQILSVPIDLDLLDVVNAIEASDLVEYSEPNFFAETVSYQTPPSDPYFVNQYYLYNTGQTVNGCSCTAGADINILNAWKITKGSSGIIISVIDEGVSPNHPDLPSTRQVRLNGSNFGDGNPNDPSPTGDMGHGDACAGLIAASHNDEGISSICPNCKIMPIRKFNSDPSIIPKITHEDNAAAIKFAADNGADVISNSWGYFSGNSNYSKEIVEAIR